jgi:hypothetical protein
VNRVLILLAAALPALAHVVSMSTGEARLTGARLDYELRMPLYEMAQIQDPESQLFANIHFRGNGGEARLLKRSCRQDTGNLVCTGLYLFDREVDQFDVECTFPSITVPNHVHLLRAIHGEKTDQAAFDASFTTATLRFRPPTAFETAFRDALAGLWRATSGLVQILFLAAIVLAARSRRELAQLTAMFLAGQAVTVATHLSVRLQMAPRFIEAATALAVAYLAVEILLLPAAGQRWLIAGLLGLLHGMYFDLLLAAGGYAAAPFMTGVFCAELAILFVFAAAAALASRFKSASRFQVERALASLLLVAGLSWFLLRLRS